MRHGLGRGADIKEDRGAIGDGGSAGAGDGLLGVLMQAAAFFVDDVGHARGQDRATVDSFEFTGIGQFGQIAADGLDRDVEPLGQIFDHDLALGPGDFQNVGLAECLRHGPLVSVLFRLCSFFPANQETR